MRLSKTIIPAAILLTLAAPAVHAQKRAKKKPAGSQAAQKPQAAPAAPQTSASDTFAAMDADHDGKITRAEWKGNAIGFAMLDRNADGALSGDELKPSSQAPARDTSADTFAKLDRNHDGHLARAEWQGDAKEFNLRDRDHDGVVTPEEYLQPVPR